VKEKKNFTVSHSEFSLHRTRFLLFFFFLCELFYNLGERGITIIIADGDTGAGDLGEPPMSQGLCKPLHADWPSQSPYVTAVSMSFSPSCFLGFFAILAHSSTSLKMAQS
jgi:subtilase family serine protease